MPTHALGIDVSRYQQTVDWPAVQAAGITFAFTKATDATNVVDPMFARNWPGIKNVGLVRGAYHFYRPALDPKRQANFFAQTVNWQPGDLPLVLDVEGDGGLDRTSLVRSVETCLAELERITGLRPILYTGPNFWNTRMANPTPPPWTSNYPLWIANYTSASQPAIPKGWATWAFWQFTDRGSVSGIGGNVDQDRFQGTAQELLQWVQAVGSGALPVTPPASQPQPSPGPIAPPVLTTPDVISRYFQALNDADPDALVVLYQTNAVHVTALETLSGTQAIRLWYQDWLQTKLSGGVFKVVEIKPVGTSWRFTWTCSSALAAVLDGQDTFGIQDGKISYHSSVFTITTV